MSFDLRILPGWGPNRLGDTDHSIWKPSREVQAHVVPSIATPIRLEIDAPNNETEIWIQLSRHLVETGGKTEESVALHLREVGQGVVITNGMISEDVEMVSLSVEMLGVRYAKAYNIAFAGGIYERFSYAGAYLKSAFRAIIQTD